MAAQSETDAGFYTLVHELLATEKQEYCSDRRNQIRQVFECQLLIAPHPVGRMPSGAEFRKVRCQNLSPSGLSYLDEQPAEQPRLLVLLGTAPFTVVMAEVVHQSRAPGGQYLIGCRFKGRLDEQA